MNDKTEMKLVKKVFPDAEVFEVDAAYEDFHAIVDGVRMIFYPHTVKSTLNQHTRVRNGTPQLQDKFIKLVALLNLAKPLNCTFTVKNKHCEVFNLRNYDFPEYPAYYKIASTLREEIYPTYNKQEQS